MRNFKWLESIRPKSVTDIWEGWSAIKKPTADTIQVTEDTQFPQGEGNKIQKIKDPAAKQTSGEKPRKSIPVKQPVRKEN